ncbi:MAG: SHD1 domain-containing protein [Thermoguttaceae bacterium]
MKAIISFVWVVLLAASASAEVRTWKDKSGRFAIRAELVESDGTAVKLKRADGKVISVPVDRLSDEDRQFLDVQEKSAFTGAVPSETAKAAPGEAKSGASPKGDSPIFPPEKSGQSPAPGLRYGWKAGKSYPYRVKIEVDLGDEVLEMAGSPSYMVVSADKDKTVLSFRGTLMEHQRPKGGGPGGPPGMPRGPFGPGRMRPPMHGMGPRMSPFSPMTGVGPFGMARTTELTVDPLGNIARQEGTSHLPFLLGNLSHLMIERLPGTEEKTWTVDRASGVVIKEGGPPRFGPFANDEGFVPARERTTYTIESATDKLVVIRKQYEFRAAATGSEKPPFEISGEGKYTFNKAEGVSGDLDFAMRVTIRKGGLGVEIPVKATYHLLDEAERAKLAEQSKEMAEKSKELLEKAKQMLAERTRPPSTEEAKSLVADLESGDRGRLMRAMFQLMQRKPKEPNRAVAKALETILSENENISMRINAAQALQNWGTKESLPVLKKAAKDSNRLVQMHAKRAIAEIESRD